MDNPPFRPQLIIKRSMFMASISWPICPVLPSVLRLCFLPLCSLPHSCGQALCARTDMRPFTSTPSRSFEDGRHALMQGNAFLGIVCGGSDPSLPRVAQAVHFPSTCASTTVVCVGRDKRRWKQRPLLCNAHDWASGPDYPYLVTFLFSSANRSSSKSSRGYCSLHSWR
jgi:hypothetical protein